MLIVNEDRRPGLTHNMIEFVVLFTSYQTVIVRAKIVAVG